MIRDNIKNKLMNFRNTIISNKLREKQDIIKEQEKTIYDLKDRINNNISEGLRALINIDKSIRICELNGNKPEATYRNLQLAKIKIKSSIADSKQLLNKYGFDYIPETNFNIIKLDNQVGG
ncbi:MAG: hypothetical protein ACI4ON_00305 [Clostridia bacterium]